MNNLVNANIRFGRKGMNIRFGRKGMNIRFDKGCGYKEKGCDYINSQT